LFKIELQYSTIIPLLFSLPINLVFLHNFSLSVELLQPQPERKEVELRPQISPELIEPFMVLLADQYFSCWPLLDVHKS